MTNKLATAKAFWGKAIHLVEPTTCILCGGSVESPTRPSVDGTVARDHICHNCFELYEMNLNRLSETSELIIPALLDGRECGTGYTTGDFWLAMLITKPEVLYFVKFEL
jgi:hypothetical protein